VGTISDPADGFVKTPVAILHDTELSDAAKLAYLEVKTFAWESIGSDCTAALRTMAGRLGWSVSKLRRALRELLDARRIEREERPGRTTRYRPTPVVDDQGPWSQTTSPPWSPVTTESDDGKQISQNSSPGRAGAREATTTTDDLQGADCPYLAYQRAEEPWNELALENAEHSLREDTDLLFRVYDEAAEEATGREPRRQPEDVKRARALLRRHYGEDRLLGDFAARMCWAWTDSFSRRVVVHGIPTIAQYDGIGRGYDAAPKVSCGGGCGEAIVPTEQDGDWALCCDCRAYYDSGQAAVVG
jgi:hypothetical protein